jgi:hypothetical protein
MITIGFGALGRGQLCRNSFTGMATAPPNGRNRRHSYVNSLFTNERKRQVPEHFTISMKR